MSPEQWLASQQRPAAPAAPAASAAATQPPAAPMSPEQWAQQQRPEMGFFESIAESVTGRQRATPETQTLPEWTSMPELNQMSVASFKSALGTMLSSPKETVQVLQANFPGMGVRQDAKGNFILRSSVDQQEYAIPPGFSVGDIPRALGGLFAFTPAGRATTIPRAIAAGGATQAAIETTQAATGGEFNPMEVGVAGVAGGAGQVLQRGLQAAIPAVTQGVQRVRQRQITPQPTPAARVEPPLGAPAAAPTAAAPQGAFAAPLPVAPAAAAAQAIPEKPAIEAATQAFEEVGDLARKASGSGFGSTAAKARLADMAEVNPEARAAAERLGMDLPFDVFSDNPQVRAAVGLTRSVAGGEAEAAWINTVRNAVNRADEITQQFDAVFIEGRPAVGAVNQRILDGLRSQREELAAEAQKIYNRINGTKTTEGLISKTDPAQFGNLRQHLERVKGEVGEGGMKAEEKRLAEMLAEEGPIPYGRLLREKTLVGKAVDGKDSPYGNIDAATLKDLYRALAQDQLDTVATLAGDEARRELRAANLLTTKQKALEKRIVGAFGQDIDGSVATLMQSAIRTASRGDAAQFNKLMKVVPKELRKETVATALASVSSSGRAAQEGAFGFAEFAKTYRGLRSNPPVYKQVVEILGPDADKTMRDLYEISKRITEARAQVLTTGKANQALVESMRAEGLIGKVMQMPMAQRAATGAASMVPGGGFVAPDIVQLMSKTSSENVKAAGKLFASDEFQRLAIEAATKPEPSAATLRRAAASKAFSDFTKAAKMPQSLDARIQWLQSALQTRQQFQQETQQ